MRRFDSLEECAEAYFNTAEKNCIISTPSIIIASNDSSIEEFKKHLEEISRMITLLYHTNIYENMVQVAADKLTKMMLARNESYSIEDLLKYLSKHYSEVDGLSLLKFQKNEDDMSISLVETSDFGAPCPQISKSTIKSIMYSLEKRRTNDGFFTCDSGHQIYYTIIPVIEQYWDADRNNRIFRVVFIFSRNKEVDEFLIRFAHRGVQGAVDAQIRRKQTEVLYKIDKVKRELNAKIQSGELKNEIDRNNFISPKIKEIARDILNSTFAHSVTIRTFNPFTEKLELSAEACYPSSSYEPNKEKSIPKTLKNSINLQCFKDCKPGDYIYHPDLINHTIENGEDLKIHNPRKSLCEACFPVWKSGIPFGTLNIEAARKGAINGDIPFLGWVATQLGDLFTRISNITPTDAIGQLSKVNDLAHSALNQEGEFDDEHLKGLTQSQKSTIESWKKFENKFREPTTIEMESSYTNIFLRDLILKELKDALSDKEWVSLHKKINWMVDINRNYKINVVMAENIQGIIRSVLSNADRHSKICSDVFRTILMKRGGVDILIIKYKSQYGKIPCEEARDFGTVPVVKDGKVRYGAFLMGERVRAANGVLAVRRPERNEKGRIPLELVIGIPMRST